MRPVGWRFDGPDGYRLIVERKRDATIHVSGAISEAHG